MGGKRWPGKHPRRGRGGGRGVSNAKVDWGFRAANDGGGSGLGRPQRSPAAGGMNQQAKKQAATEKGEATLEGGTGGSAATGTPVTDRLSRGPAGKGGREPKRGGGGDRRVRPRRWKQV